MSDFVRRYDVLPFAYALWLAAMVLTNNIPAPRTLYFAAVLPAAFFAGLLFWRRVLTGSVIFWSVAVYLLAMGLASLGAADIPHNDLSRHFRLIPLILSYLVVVTILVSDERWFRRILLWSCVILGLSALINVSVYLAHSGKMCPPIVSPARLCSIVGMPEYFNSTNLSAPYALYAVAAVGAFLHGGGSRIERVLLAASAAVLVVALILTESRSGFVAAALGCIVLAVSGRRWRRLAFAAAGALVVIVVAAQPHLRELVLVRGSSYRPELWSAYLAMAVERPFTGVGILNNIDVTMRDGYIVDQPHNLVLAGFVRGGIAGALAIAAAIAAGMYYAARFWLKTQNAIPLALIVTMFGYGMLDYQLLATYPTWPWISFWFPIGLCIGAETSLRAELRSAASTAAA